MYYVAKENFVNSAGSAAAYSQCVGTEVLLEGYLQSVRRLGKIAFATVRGYAGFVQVSFEEQHWRELLHEGLVVRIRGTCRQEERAPGGFEIKATSLEILTQPVRELPFTLGKKELGLALETDLEHRPFTLRHPRHFNRFRLQAALAEGFRRSLRAIGFQEVFTPKIVPGCAEGGANMFQLQYFGREMYLAQSPQLYKQMLVGVYGRVFEVGHVYRAELHNTSRHLNEYVSLDLEMGFVRGVTELMAVQSHLVNAMFDYLRLNYATSLAELDITLPEAVQIPALHLEEAKALIQKYASGLPAEKGCLSTAEERALGAAVKEEYGSEMVFVTNYHSTVRPFYTQEAEAGETASFDLLFRGVEITTGGMRIHKPKELKVKMRELGLNLESFRHYLAAFEYGLPPHGGSGTGLERLTMLIAGESNIRQGTLFPRDTSRVEP